MSWLAIGGGGLCALASIVSLFFALTMALGVRESYQNGHGDDLPTGIGFAVSFLALGAFEALAAAAIFGML